MTRNDMQQDIQTELKEFYGSDGDADPVSLDRAINSAADTIARALDAYYVHYSTDLVSGTQEYCLPDIYKMKSAQILDAAGQVQLITPGTPQMMDSITGAWWRQNPETSGTPRVYLTEGVMRCKLYPIPNYSTTAPAEGLTFEGLAVPGMLWANLSSECPLTPRMHDAVVAQAKLIRARRMDNVTDRKMQTLQSESRRLMGELEGENYTMTAATNAGRMVRARYSSYTW